MPRRQRETAEWREEGGNDAERLESHLGTVLPFSRPTLFGTFKKEWRASFVPVRGAELM